MSLLHPLGLLALLAVPVLVALSLWRWRRREVVVSSLLLWRDVAAAWRQAPHARRRRQLDPLLLLRVAVALALAAALCAPVWLRPAGLARRLVTVLDRSASLAARRADGRTRWRAGRDELLTLLARLDAADRVEVIAVPPPTAGGTGFQPVAHGQDARATGPGLDPRDAASLLLRIEPSDAPVAPQQLVHAATDAARERPGARVLVATDASLAGLPAGIGVLATGGPLRNLGITAFATRTDALGREETLATVTSGGDKSASAEVALLADGRQIARSSVAVPPGGSRPVVFDARLGAATALEARLGGADDLAADDRAWLARGAGRVRVAWVGDEDYYLRRALAVQSDVELTDLAEVPPGGVPRGFDLAVFYHAVPHAATRGRLVLVAPRAAVAGLRPGPLVEAGPASVAAPRDPLMAAVRLDGVALGHVYKPASLPVGFETLATAGDVPVIGRWREGAATLVYVGVDPAASAWALDPSFPIFWANVVAEAAGRGPEAGAFQCVRPDELVPVGGDGETRIEEPDGTQHPLAGGAFRPESTGLYRIVRGKTVRTVAVSLLSREETLAAGSELGPPSGLLSRPEERGGLAIAWRLGGWLALLALGLVVLHGCLQR